MAERADVAAARAEHRYALCDEPCDGALAVGAGDTDHTDLCRRMPVIAGGNLADPGGEVFDAPGRHVDTGGRRRSRRVVHDCGCPGGLRVHGEVDPVVRRTLAGKEQVAFTHAATVARNSVYR